MFQSPCHLCLFALNVLQLHILNDKYPTLLVIAIIVVQGRSSINNNMYFMKVQFHVINTSYQSRKLKIKLLYLMEAIPKLHPSSLLTDSLGAACLYLIYMLKIKQTPIWGLSCPQVNNSLPFIWLPRSDAISIIASSGLNRIYAALEACEKLRKVTLVQGEQKRIFTD